MTTLPEAKFLARWNYNEYSKRHSFTIQWPYPSRIHEVVGYTKLRNGRWQWFRNPPSYYYKELWATEHAQGHAMTLEEAKAEIEKGWVDIK